MANSYYTFSSPFVPGTKVRSDEMNNELDAIEAGFDLLPSDPTSVERGTAYIGTESGSGNAYVVTRDNPQVSYQDGDKMSFFATHTNTGASTVNADGIGAASIVSANGSALTAGDLVDGLFYEMVFDLSNNRWQLITPVTSTITAAETRVSWAEEWANKAEDSLVSTAAGGDGATEYSSLHWAAKAAASATAASNSASAASTSASNASDSADAAAASAGSVNLPALGAGDVGKFLQVNATFDGYDLLDLFGSSNTWTDEQIIQGDNSMGTANYLYFRDHNNTTRWRFSMDSSDVLHVDSGFKADVITAAQNAGTLALTNTDITFDGTSLLGAGGGVIDEQIFTAGGTWTKPADAVRVEIICVGGGGGSAGAAATASYRGGGGGGGGQFVRASINAADLASTESVTVGSGGSGGAVGNNAGSAGGDSQFSSSDNIVLADAGSGGSTSASDDNVGAPGQGGFSESLGANTYDSIVIDGTQGGEGEVLPTDGVVFCSTGGPSGGAYGSGTPPRANDGGNKSGYTGRGYGGGAGAGAAAGGSSVAGTDGAGGIVIVRTYG